MAFPRNGRAAALLPALFAGSMAVPPATGAAAGAAVHTPARSVFTANLISRYSDRCLSVDSAGTYDGARMLQWTCGTQTNQQWNLAATDNGYYRVLAVNSGKCLSVADAGTANGAGVVQWACGSRDNQQWRLLQRDDGYFSIVARHSGKCLSLTGDKTQNGAIAIQWECGSQHDQHWRLG